MQQIVWRKIAITLKIPARTSMEVAFLKDGGRGRQVYGSPSALKKAKADKKFPSVVALARAVNALNSTSPRSSGGSPAFWFRGVFGNTKRNPRLWT
jgi:hypothetical protein